MNERIPSTAFADAWIHVDHTDDPHFFVQVLDATRRQLLERARRSPDAFFEPLDVQPGQCVLDVGCGTGDMLRLLAPLVAPGRAVGVDLSETMIAEARRRTTGSAATIEYCVGDVQDLAFEAASFDRVVAAQVLVHVPNPGRALAEMGRVLVPGGMLWVTEVDWGTVAVDSTDRALGRRFTQLACDELRNGLIVRELAWRLRDLGFGRMRLMPQVEVAHDLDAFYHWFVEPALSHFVRMGGFTAEEAQAFRSDLQERARQGRYFSARTVYGVLASRSG